MTTTPKKAKGDWNSRQEPLRLRTPEEYVADPKKPYVGVTGSLYAGEEATVVLCAPGKGWIHMDVEYAKQTVLALMEVIQAGEKHNAALTTPPLD